MFQPAHPQQPMHLEPPLAEDATFTWFGFYFENMHLCLSQNFLMLESPAHESFRLHIDKHESHAGKLVTVKGTVIRQLPARPVVFQIQYSCTKCGEVMDIECPDGRVKQPTACTATGCKSKSFQPSMASVVTEDWQKIRIQELLNVEHGAGHSSAARTLEVELSIDCVGCCMCGDVRTLFPVLKTYLLES